MSSSGTGKVKVLALIWSMGAGGAEKVVLNHLMFFRNDPDIDYRLVVFCAPGTSQNDKAIAETGLVSSGTVRYLNYPHSRITVRFIRAPFNLLAARRAIYNAICGIRPDIVHVHIDELLDKALYGIVKANVPIRLDTLHSDPSRYKGRILRLIRKAFGKEGFIPICLNNAQAAKAEKLYGFTQYEIVRNGVDFSEVRAKCIRRQDAVSRLSALNEDLRRALAEKDAFIVCAAGRFAPVKNYSLLIDVFSEVHKRRPDSMLIIAGDGEEKTLIEEKAVRLGIRDRVFLPGYLNDVTALYCAADTLCITSFSEALSLTLLEAQACGTHCVISNGCPEESILTDKVQRMSAQASVSAWAEAVLNTQYRGEPVCSFEDYDLMGVLNKQKEVYLKYAGCIYDK